MFFELVVFIVFNMVFAVFVEAVVGNELLERVGPGIGVVGGALGLLHGERGAPESSVRGRGVRHCGRRGGWVCSTARLATTGPRAGSTKRAASGGTRACSPT